MYDPYRLQGIVGNEECLTRFYRYMDPDSLIVGGNITPHWMLDGVSFWYAVGVPHDTVILRVDGVTGKVGPLFDVTKTRKSFAAVIRRELPYSGLPFDSVVELGDGRYRFAFEGSDYVLSIDTYAIGAMRCDSVISEVTRQPFGLDPGDRAVPRLYRRPIWLGEQTLVREIPSPDARWFASVKDGNIILRAPIDDRSIVLTTDGTPDFTWDIEAPRSKNTAGMHVVQHRLEPWSPDGHKLFAIKLDRRKVPDMPLIRYLKREAEACSLKVQRAGGPIDIAHPHVVDVLAKRSLRFDVGETEDQFFTLIGWLPDGSEVLFTRHSRDFKTVDVLAGDPVDGSVRTVLSENAKSFVALQHDVIFSGDNHVTILPDGSGLIWRSSRSGWNHFYHYAIDGTLTGVLTRGNFPVIDVVATDKTGGWVYFTAHHDQDRPYDTHLCRVKFSGAEMQRLTRLDGENVVSISPSTKTFTVVNSRPDRPFRTDFLTCEGKLLGTVEQADITALERLGDVASEEFTVTAADGETVLWGVIHKPADFDPKKKYPLIDHLYGGPQVAMVAHNFTFGDDSHVKSRLDRALAQLGYIVISVDARGTPERSKAFQDVVYRNWGRHEIPDHVATIQQLAQRHAFIDLNRVGVWGHSWGGYFTIRAMAQAPEVFHVGVAAAGGTDPYDMFIYEPYLDLPTRAKSAYDYAGLYQWADKIEGKLMLVVGTCDAHNHSFAMKMGHYLIQAGVDHELVVLPETYHRFSGEEDGYFIRKLINHFEVHLKQRKTGTTFVSSGNLSNRGTG